MKLAAFFVLVISLANTADTQTSNMPPVDQEKQAELRKLDTVSRVSDIQAALRQQGFDGWLFYDFRGSDILTPRILKTERLGGSRRWFYFIPTQGEPVKVVHAIEPDQIDVLPGKKLIYREWGLLKKQVDAAIRSQKGANGKLRIA